MTEGKALRELKAGSEEALCYFIDRYSPYVSTIIQNITGGTLEKETLEETCADVFFAFWKHAQAVRPGFAKSYLGAIARNMGKNKLRDLGKPLPLEEDVLILEQLSPEAELEKKELQQIVRRAVLAMGQPEKEIFLRHYYYYQTLEQISREMGIPLSTVKTKLRRGRLRLKQALENAMN